MTLKEIINNSKTITHWSLVNKVGINRDANGKPSGINYFTRNTSLRADEQDLKDWDFSDFDVAQNVTARQIANAPLDAIVIEHKVSHNLIVIVLK